ncbi:MAG: efflux transporter outer membrane subunit [Lysobacteraceae bacterium]
MSRHLSLAAAVAGALLVSGCASTGGLQPASAPQDASAYAVTRSLAGAPLSDAAFPRRDWWRALGDPQLDALVDEALRGTPSLAAADARVRKAQAQAELADVARQPGATGSVRYSGAYLPQSLISAPFGGDYKGVELGLVEFAYAPDLWGGHRDRWEAAVDLAHAAEADAQQARLLLSSNLARTYVGLAQAFDAKAVAEREGARARQQLDLARRRVRAGLDNALQTRQAEGAVAAAQQQADAAQQRIDALRNALAALTGQGPDRGLAIQPPALLAVDAPALPSDLPSELLGHRPDVVAARWRAEAATKSVAAAKTDFYPSVNLSAMVGIAAGKLSDLFTRDAAFGTGGPAISLPIFNGRRLRGQLASTDADADLAYAQYDQTVVGALREVADALQAARALDAQIASLAEAREAARKAQALAETRRRAGLGTQLDVLAAQRPVYQLDAQIAGLRAERRNVAADLAVALGGGFAPVPPPAEAQPASDSDPTPDSSSTSSRTAP